MSSSPTASPTEVLAGSAPYLDSVMLRNFLRFEAAQPDATPAVTKGLNDITTHLAAATPERIAAAEKSASVVLDDPKYFSRSKPSAEGKPTLKLERRDHIYTRELTSGDDASLVPSDIPPLVDEMLKLAYYYHVTDRSSESVELIRFISNLKHNERQWFLEPERRSQLLWSQFAANAVAYSSFARSTFDYVFRSFNERDDIAKRLCFLHYSFFFVFKLMANDSSVARKLAELIFNGQIETHETPTRDINPRVFQQLLQGKAAHLLRHAILVAIVQRHGKNSRLIIDRATALLRSCGKMDPVLDFARTLWIDFDFLGAARQIPSLKEVLARDFYMQSGQDAITARLYEVAMEGYLRTHRVVSLDFIAQSTGVSANEVESWTSSLVRSSGIKSKMDSVQRQIIISPSVKDALTRVEDILSYAHSSAAARR